jgi:NAD(P)-dependent dehydrogenase (short-subunit alcohol dehydrogenase family)
VTGRFEGKVAFVTEATSGIGRATALVSDITIEGNRETARVIEQAGRRSFGRLDIAFNNAGAEQPIKPVHEITDDEWDRLVAVNEMMRRFTGDSDEGRAAVIAQEPIGRMGKPEEIAAAVLWLCSDEAAFTIGHAMVVDGGQTA